MILTWLLRKSQWGSSYSLCGQTLHDGSVPCVLCGYWQHPSPSPDIHMRAPGTHTQSCHLPFVFPSYRPEVPGCDSRYARVPSSARRAHTCCGFCLRVVLTPSRQPSVCDSGSTRMWTWLASGKWSLVTMHANANVPFISSSVRAVWWDRNALVVFAARKVWSCCKPQAWRTCAPLISAVIVKGYKVDIASTHEPAP
jgi:hypothetical protein